MNPVIVVSRNLDRIYEEGGKRLCISFSSSSGDPVIEFLRKEETFFFLNFQIVYSKFNFFIQSFVSRSLCSVHVREM